MRIVSPSIRVALLGALVFAPLCARPTTTWADLTATPKAVADTKKVETRQDIPFGDRTIRITSSVRVDDEGNEVGAISDEEVGEIVAAIDEMVNGSPDGTPPEEALQGSAFARTLIDEATVNDTKTLEIRLSKDFNEVALSGTDSKDDAADQGLILLNIKAIKALRDCLGDVVESRLRGRGVAVDPGVLAVAKRVLLIDMIAHEIRHAGTNLVEVTDAQGNVTLEPKPGTNATGNNFPDGKPTQATFDNSPSGRIPQSPAVAAANQVVQQNLAGTGLTHVRPHFAYFQRNPLDFNSLPKNSQGQPVAHKVYDLHITAADGTRQIITVRFEEVLVKNTKTTSVSTEEDDDDEPAETPKERRQERRETRQRESGGGCLASTIPTLLTRLESVPEVQVTETPDPLIPDTSTGGTGIFDDSLTDGDTDGFGDTDTDGFGDTDTDGFDDTDTDGFDDTDTDGGGTVICSPDSASFTGGVVPQAGVDIDLRAQTCTTVSGLPPQDQLVIDDFGGGNFGGSGSDLTVVSMTGGTFENTDFGFYTLDQLAVGSPVEIEFETADGERFTVRFTIQPGAGGAPAELVDTQVEF